jgi:hypothetical protein
LTALVHRGLYRKQAPGRIDGLMLVSLGYIVWFGLIPVLNLL